MPRAKRHYARPNHATGYNVDVNPLAEQIQLKLTARQERVIEVAVDHLDGFRHEHGHDGIDDRTPVEYAINLLLYGARPAKADYDMMVGALKTMLLQAHILTHAERRELLGVPDGV